MVTYADLLPRHVWHEGADPLHVSDLVEGPADEVASCSGGAGTTVAGGGRLVD